MCFPDVPDVQKHFTLAWNNFPCLTRTLFSFSLQTRIVLLLHWLNFWAFTEWQTPRIHSHEWMNVHYLLPCVHLMQDFCTVPNSSVCCLTGQAKLSLFHGEGGILMSFVLPGALPPWHQWRTWTFTGEPRQGFSGVNQICWEEAMSNLRGSCSYSSTI